MIYALDSNGSRVEASPRMTATCPQCGGEVISKCGEINAWHWAHAVGDECDPWSETESLWHSYWKAFFPPEKVEVGMGTHRADIVNRQGLVIELQASALSPSEIRERERFYNRMIWLFDVTDCEERFWLRQQPSHCNFRWCHPRKHIASTEKPTYLDFGKYIFHLKKMYPDTPCGGWGYVLTYHDFIRRVLLVSNPEENRLNWTSIASGFWREEEE
jgi:competence protein CoiA